MSARAVTSRASGSERSRACRARSSWTGLVSLPSRYFPTYTVAWQASRPALPSRSIVVDRPVANVTVVTPRTTAASVRALRPGRANGRPSPHVARIFAKLQLRDRDQAVVIAYEKGLVRARES